MSADQLLDAHTKRMDTDPGYVAIWRKATALPNMQLIAAMLAWAEQADVRFLEDRAENAANMPEAAA